MKIRRVYRHPQSKVFTLVAAALMITAYWINYANVQQEIMAQSKHVQATANETKLSQQCKPTYHISFIKIHKTGSGSFHNRLVRIAVEKKLNVALPKCPQAPKNFHVFPAKARGEFLYKSPPNTNVSEYNMFLDHAVFDRIAQMEYLLYDVKFVTQLRHPYEQARSLFEHFQHAYYKTNAFDEFISNPHRVDKKQRIYCCFLHQMPEISVTRNFQAFTLGFENAFEENIPSDDFDLFLNYLHRTLDFVSILELKDESNVLMKRKFCWNMKDILELHTHKITNTTMATNISSSQFQNHQMWSPLDYRLYEHFKQKLLDEIKSQPSDFHEEVAEYQNVNAQFEAFCQDMCTTFQAAHLRNITNIRKALEDSITIPASKFNGEFTISYLDCLLSMAQEKSLQNVLKFQQFADACTNSSLMEEYGMSEPLCNKHYHVYPGFHYHYFYKKVLKTENCKTRKYIDFRANSGL